MVFIMDPLSSVWRGTRHIFTPIYPLGVIVITLKDEG
jgi:hypothetical protein